MRAFILLMALFCPFLLRAQAWVAWRTTPVLTKGADGAESFRRLTGKDSKGRLWQIHWTPKAVVVSAPDGSHKELDQAFPREAHPGGGMSIRPSDTEQWADQEWECFKVLINTGRNGIALHHFILIVLDLKTEDWAVCGGRIADGKLDGPHLKADEWSLQWTDDHETRSLAVEHAWKLHRGSKAIAATRAAPVYRLQSGYPVWFRFWSDVAALDPDEAEYLGWLSIAWDLADTSKAGGMAHSNRVAIPKHPGHQVWREGTGPDCWFPIPDRVPFQWNDDVEVHRRGRPSSLVDPAQAAGMTADGAWGVVLERTGDGRFLGSVLVERRALVEGLRPLR